MAFMDMHLWDLLPVVICETAAIRNESGEIVDLEWTASNRLMNESIRTDGGSVVGMRIFEFDDKYRSSDMVRAVTEVIETGEQRSFITSQGRAARMLGKVMKTTIIPTERDGERRALSVSHEITDIAQERDEALRLYELAKAACDNALHGIVLVVALLTMQGEVESLVVIQFDGLPQGTLHLVVGALHGGHREGNPTQV